jgi:hypothetical protein
LKGTGLTSAHEARINKSAASQTIICPLVNLGNNPVVKNVVK